MKKNIYGLSRNIPLDVSDEVRRRSHYGCVICGEIPYQFEHIEPEFKDAVEHNANNITLLCPTCHTKVTNGIISKLVVKKATLNPYCKSNGYNFMGLAPSFNDFTFSFGNAKFVKPRFPIILNGIPIVAVNYDMRRETILLNCKFFDRLGHLVAEVIDNEWKTFIDGVDIKLIRKTLTVKRLNEKILSVTFEESNVIRVDYMHMIEPLPAKAGRIAQLLPCSTGYGL